MENRFRYTASGKIRYTKLENILGTHSLCLNLHVPEKTLEPITVAKNAFGAKFFTGIDVFLPIWLRTSAPGNV